MFLVITDNNSIFSELHKVIEKSIIYCSGLNRESWK